MKNTALKYTMLLIEFFILSVFIHFITIAPLIDIYCIDYICSNLMNTFLLMNINKSFQLDFDQSVHQKRL